MVDNTKSFEENDIKWKPFLRQILIASSSWCTFFCLGMVFGSPTVIIPQLRRDHIPVSDEEASWLSSMFSYAAVPWIFILAIMSRYIGRKKTSIFISLGNILGFIVFYFSTTPIHLLISEAIFGITQATAVSISIITITEYTSPKYRGIYLCLKSANYYWGIWVSNAIGAFTFWGNIPIVGLCVSLYPLTVFCWPESPLWLASKNRFAECRRAHRWLRGKSKTDEIELDKLIQSQRESANAKITPKDYFRREFLMPLSLTMLLIAQLHLSGKFIITFYAIDIIKTIINDESKAYVCMLILDGVTVFSTYIGCLTAKLFKRRTIFFTTSSIAISFLLILTLYLYLIKLSIVSENVYVSIFLLAMFSISLACGPTILCTSLYGELLPARYKSVTSIITAIEYVSFNGTLLKIAPSFIVNLSLHGAILFYALSSGACTCLLYFYLPETKDKTLLEIEEYFKDKKKVGNRMGKERKYIAESPLLDYIGVEKCAVSFNAKAML